MGCLKALNSLSEKQLKRAKWTCPNKKSEIRNQIGSPLEYCQKNTSKGQISSNPKKPPLQIDATNLNKLGKEFDWEPKSPTFGKQKSKLQNGGTNCS